MDLKNFCFVLLFTVGICLNSCTEKEPKIPASVIARDSMIIMLADLHLAESRLIQQNYKPDNEKFKSAYIKSVLQNAGVDSTRFNRSFLFYSSHPDYFQDMYEAVITEISKRQAEVKVEKKNAPPSSVK